MVVTYSTIRKGSKKTCNNIVETTKNMGLCLFMNVELFKTYKLTDSVVQCSTQLFTGT